MSGGPDGPHKLGMRSPGSAGPDLDWQKLHHQFFEQEHNKNNMDPDHMGNLYKPHTIKLRILISFKFKVLTLSITPVK